MTRVRAAGGRLAMIVGMLLVSSAAWAQQPSAIAGVVRDTSGGVLPGVTVEASSPALIEKVRSVVTDGEGRYNIVDLRPGDYVVTFTLAGFNTFRREGIVLTAGFTATVNADMQVGALEETITVTGEAPLVDTQNVRQQAVVAAQLRAELPSGAMNLMSIARLIPGMTGGADPGGGGTTSLYSTNQSTAANIHGKAGSKQAFDGMQTNNLSGEGSTSYTMNPAMVVETVVETGGISAESNASGLAFNMIPKDGGNNFEFGANGTFAHDSLATDQLSDRLKARGVTSPAKLLRAYDANFTVGGPLRRDKVWFFAGTRFQETKNLLAGLFFNKTRGTPFYTPDLEQPQFTREWMRSQGVRLTWQVSERNRVTGFADPQYFMTRGGGNAAPEAQSCLYFWHQGLYQSTWTSPVTSRLLLEGGVSLTKGPWPCTREHVTDQYGFTVSPGDVSIREASTGFRYNAASEYRDRNDQDRYYQRFIVSYVTGSHTFKTGIQLQQHVHNQIDVVNSDSRNAACLDCPVSYVFNRGVPTTVEMWATPWLKKHRTKADLGLFVQDQWAINRLTLNYGLRFDYFNGYVPAQETAATPFVPGRRFDPVHDVPEWFDLNPRVGLSYDLFGDSRTALKVSLGRYVGRETTVMQRANNPITTSINNVRRSWNDANGNFVPDCDLKNFGANGECGKISNDNFGKSNPRAVQYSDDLTRGWGKREYFWDVAAELQRELRQGLSVRFGYYRNWSDHFGAFPRGENSVPVADNLAVTPADYDPYCITAPVDSRLPGGGGYQVCGLYDIKPEKFGVGDILVTRASNYGNGRTRHSDFFTVAMTGRLNNGTQFGASLDTGRTVEDHCFTVDSPQKQISVRGQGIGFLPSTRPVLECRTVNPFKGQLQIKTYWVQTLPAGFVVSGIWENLSGVPYEANYRASNAEIAPSLGRNLAGGARTAVVPLLAPYTHFEPRRSLLDLRMSKMFELGDGKRLRVNFDVYNVFNNDAILGINETYGASWLRPQGRSMAAARLVQLGGQIWF